MYKYIVTHNRPHLDEIAAIWILKKFGEQIFPGISTAQLIFWETGGQTPNGRSAQEYDNEGYLLLGVGGGRFDEHPGDDQRKKEECAFTLVMRALGLIDEPYFEKIITFVKNNDLKGAANPFDLAQITQSLHQQHPNDPHKVIEWVSIGLESKFQEQIHFWTVTKNEFIDKAKIEEIPGPGFTIKLVTIISDDEQISKFARSEQGCNAGIIIQRKTSGNVQIFTNQKFGLRLHDVVQMIRREEQKIKGKIITSDWKTLCIEGRVEGAEEWWYVEKMQCLLNGSTTANNVIPTLLTLEKIVEIVKIGINPQLFEPVRSDKCEQGICNSTNRNPCPWYNYGLSRCRKVRFEQSKK